MTSIELWYQQHLPFQYPRFCVPPNFSSFRMIAKAPGKLVLVALVLPNRNIAWRDKLFETKTSNKPCKIPLRSEKYKKKQRSSGASRRAWNAARWRHVLFSMVLAVFLCFFHLLVSCHFMFGFLKFWAKFPWHHSFAHVARGYSEMHLFKYFKCWW